MVGSNRQIIKLIWKGMLLLIVAIASLAVLIMLSVFPATYDKVNLATDSARFLNFGKAEADAIYERSMQNYGKEKAIFGDSVSGQLFIGYNEDEFDIITGNQAMTFMYQYVLVDEYIRANPQVKDIYMIVTFDTLSLELQDVLSYQYAVLPLARCNRLSVVDDYVMNELNDLYGGFFMNNDVAQFVEKSGIIRKIYLSYLENHSEKNGSKIIKDPEKISHITDVYLWKIYSICNDNGINMHLIPCPAKDTNENRLRIKNLKESYLQTKIGKTFPGYFDGITYYSEEQFKDELHFKDNLLTDEYRDEIIEGIRSATGDNID